ncbi:type II toxin-antitoxin system HicB family antitoxin [Acinetobacter sp. V91_7]|uniref:type II toxin-antitoxin system HicB family antitoxin n=1 Tax=unclassified Acinetobacter TaxID=196816 RepID=UPI00287F01DC|nr:MULTISPECIES: type II toxin-antitoxin system HicB family antitoxin [unclassified Acinetobacter]MDS7927926.1 type II toxin-antitoxin system HicB family antitoxin [Acinetobacter sp. V102_4]MDS7932882.1 type II toxin-antitoxin system HicB family antitoxin [Acinetobacter sp. V91_4B]MDS7961857.1 type II toxin-antitoxin system HicB family antitoxin [Acinetobacter sp. V91_7]MDS8028930.1 type II toxin-antitoxin system HicB family antitoxin [Acinetobacter sp. V91_13]
MSYLKYKGYLGTIEPDIETGELFGKLAFIRDLVTYEAETLKELEREFQFSVDGYLASCAELGKSPEQPLKGTFNVCIPPELHRKAVMAAGDSSLNAFVSEAISEKLVRLYD